MASLAELTESQRDIFASTASATNAAAFSPPTRRALWSEPAGRERPGQQFEVVAPRGPLPIWLRPLVNGLRAVLALPADWDSYGAPRIALPPVLAAFELAANSLGPNSPPPSVVPLSSGGVQFEWHRQNFELEIVFEPGEPASFSWSNPQTGEEDSGELPTGERKLRSYLKDLK